MEKPKKLEDKHLMFLDVLRESGVTNMFGGGSYLREEYPDLSKQESYQILSYWMETFEERHYV